MATDVFRYKPVGVCGKLIEITITNNIIDNIAVMGGCNGNMQGINLLAKGLHVDEVISKLQGIKCGAKSTSCPDQIANALITYKSEKEIS